MSTKNLKTDIIKMLQQEITHLKQIKNRKSMQQNKKSQKRNRRYI